MTPYNPVEAHADAQAARQFLGEVIARPGIQQQFARVGVSSSALGARVAALSDSEVVQMQKQLMSKELQAAPAGRMDMMTAYIIGLGVGAVILLIVLVAAAGSTPYYYY